MFNSKKYLKLLSFTDGSDLDKEISKMSESDVRQLLKIMIQFFHEQELDSNNIIQFLHEQLFFKSWSCFLCLPTSVSARFRATFAALLSAYLYSLTGCNYIQYPVFCCNQLFASGICHIRAVIRTFQVSALIFTDTWFASYGIFQRAADMSILKHLNVTSNAFFYHRAFIFDEFLTITCGIADAAPAPVRLLSRFVPVAPGSSGRIIWMPILPLFRD